MKNITLLNNNGGSTRVFAKPSLTRAPENVLTRDRQKAAAQVLGHAFAKDPFMTYVLPDSRTRAQQLSKLFLPLIYGSQHYGEVLVTPDDGGVLAWVPGQFFSIL